MKRLYSFFPALVFPLVILLALMFPPSNPWPGGTGGHTVVYFGQNDNGDGTAERAADRIWANEFVNGAGSGNITEIGLNLSSALTGHVRLGVYAESASPDQPGTLLLDAGVLTNPGTGWQSITGLSLAVTNGTTYWLCWITDAATTTYVNGSYNFSYDNTTVYGALPATFPTIAGTIASRQSIRAGVTASAPPSAFGSPVIIWFSRIPRMMRTH
jgi:hypothetical protein